MHIGIVNGPNLGHIGTRETDIYGVRSMEDYLEELQESYNGLQLSYMQSNHEGALLDELYRLDAEPECIGIVLNAGAYTHTSIALLDAIRAISLPVIEVHISNIQAREHYRHASLITEACLGCITGLGLMGYGLAVEALLRRTSTGSKA